MRSVPDHIARPPYADTGEYEPWDEGRVKSPEIIERMRVASTMAAEVLRLAGEFVRPGMTTDEIDEYVTAAADHGMYTVIDMHQDAYSAFISTPPGETCPAGSEPGTCSMASCSSGGSS